MGLTDGIQGTPGALQTDSLLAGLTDSQREAVLHTEGPVLVLAAAGSGKTRVITRRIAHLIGQGIPPWSILALTFTNKAAGEMRERVLALLGEEPRLTRGLTVTTFHSLCARLLRRYAEVSNLPGLKADFTIYDSPDQAALVKRVLGDLQLNTSNWPPRSVLAAISNAKNDLLDAAAFAARSGDFYSKNVAKIYAGYERGLRAAGAVDFDDLLMLTAKMLRESAEIRGLCQERWQYLLIDEYQDTNHAQFVIASLLAGERAGAPSDTAQRAVPPPETAQRAVPPGAAPNICVVGDPDQSIYGWRGADVTNILEFEEQYPGAAVITLGENFRSTAPILAVADALIRQNKRRKHKDLYTRREGGERVRVVLCRNEQHEAELVVDEFRRLKDEEGLSWKDMAVFYRTNALSRVMEDALRSAGIPYVIARGTAFYQREEIKNALAYLRVVANQADDVSLERVINTPTRGIGKTSLVKVQDAASAAGVSLFEGLRRHSSESCATTGSRWESCASLSARAVNAIGAFVQMVDGWTGGGTFMGVEHTPAEGELAELVERVIEESGLERMYKQQAEASKSEADAERLENLAELVSSARQFEAEYDPDGDPAFSDPAAMAAEDRAQRAVPPLLALLRAYLESVTLVADADAVDPAQGAVMLMTLHAAKGLEFPAVAMIGLEEGVLPHGRANESEADLEEERRLCFVGITRAMRKLTITSAKYRTQRGMTERTIGSRFLEELGREHVVVSDEAGLEEWDSGSEYSRGAVSSSRGRAKGGVHEGAIVRHPRFGLGEVVMAEGGRVRVRFRDAGTKTLLLEYARLEVVG